MKKILKRNQVMITALTLMIVIAGYLHFAGTQVSNEDLLPGEKESVATSSEGVSGITEYTTDMEMVAADGMEISDKDALLSSGIETGEDAVTQELAAGTDIESLDTEYAETDPEYSQELADAAALPEESTQTEADPATVDEIPGEAVYTSTTGVASLSGARLQKEQTRAKNKETLLEIINNVNVTDDQKQEAINKMLEATELAEKESAAEILLEAKGYTDAVVSISDGVADVLVYGTTLTDVQCAQIEDIVKRKTDIEAANIIITPVTDIE